MANQVAVIESGSKLRITRDVYLGEKQIPTGSIFYAFSYDPTGRIEPQVISGFGPNLVTGIRVTDENPMNYKFGEWPKKSILLPLTALRLAD